MLLRVPTLQVVPIGASQQVRCLKSSETQPINDQESCSFLDTPFHVSDRENVFPSPDRYASLLLLLFLKFRSKSIHRYPEDTDRCSMNVVNYSATSYRASCFNHRCLAIRNVLRRWVPVDTSSLLKSNPGSHLQLPGEVSPDAEFVGSIKS